jgi:hypothetical protein
MDPLSFHFLRIALRGFAHTLGSVGVFCLYWSCMGAPVAAYALVCLGTATAIILGSDGVTRLEG